MSVELFKTESELKLPRNWLQVSFRRVKIGSRDPSATKPLQLNKELFHNASKWFTTVNLRLGKSGRLFKTPLRDYNQEQKFPVRLITRAGITKEIHPWGEESSWKSFFLAFPTPAPKCKTVFSYPHTLKLLFFLSTQHSFSISSSPAANGDNKAIILCLHFCLYC